MLGKRYRFHGHNSLNLVYRRGQTVRTPALSLRFSSRSGGKPSRVAIVVSRKVSKSATVRNRIRRRIYELVRGYDEALLTGNDLIFTAFSEQLAEMDHEQLAGTVQDLLTKSGLVSRK